MDWKEYLSRPTGKGFLATASSTGEVDIAVFSHPHILADSTIAWGMADRLTHKNLTENPHAVYAFSDIGYSGVRLFLQKTKEETSGPLLDQIRKEADRAVHPGIGDMVKFVVYFKVTKTLPLVGT